MTKAERPSWSSAWTTRPAQNPAIVNALVGQGAQIQFVNELKHSLEDVYLSLIQNNATL